jgi:hypothetical protein
MLKNFIILLLSFFITLTTQGFSNAHPGGIDKNGGHNCKVKECSGKYHCHKDIGLCKNKPKYIENKNTKSKK